MTQFSIGTCVFEQIRGSPMCSPLSPALCLMVVALSEEVWHRTFESTLTTMNLTSRLLRYVDNRLCLVDSHTGSETQPWRHSFTRSSTARRSSTRNSCASALSSNLLLFGTLHRRLQSSDGSDLGFVLSQLHSLPTPLRYIFRLLAE